MGMNINTGNSVKDNYQYKTINKNSEQYKAAARENVSGDKTSFYSGKWCG